MNLNDEQQRVQDALQVLADYIERHARDLSIDGCNQPAEAEFIRSVALGNVVDAVIDKMPWSSAEKAEIRNAYLQRHRPN